MAQLTCRDVSLGYEGHAILTGLNFTCGTGDYLCIVGENGSGMRCVFWGCKSLWPAKSYSATG